MHELPRLLGTFNSLTTISDPTMGTGRIEHFENACGFGFLMELLRANMRFDLSAMTGLNPPSPLLSPHTPLTNSSLPTE